MKKFFLLTLCCLFAFTPIMAQNGLAADGWYEYTVSEGNLSELISESEKYQITRLRLKGKVNGSDFRLIRDMAGLPFEFNYDKDNFTAGRLQYLDLSGAEVVFGGNYGTFNNNWTPSCFSNSISEYMFQYSPSLVEVQVGNSVTKISTCAFADCPALQKVNMPGVTELNGGATFKNCTSLTSVNIPNVTKFSGNTFSGCTSLSNIDFPNLSQTSNAEFKDCIALSSVSIPKVSNELSFEVFSGCSSLKSISLPEIKKIGRYCFSGCTALSEVSLPVLRGIPEYCFRDCSSLLKIDFPEVLEIDWYAFINCSSLVSVSLKKTTKIGSSAFQYCTSLKTISCPALNTISGGCFLGCSALQDVSFPLLKIIEHSGAFQKCSSLQTISLPLVENIPPSTFTYCPSLQTVSLPSAKIIGESAFSGCSSLQTISMPVAEEIGTRAFSNCTSLKSISADCVKIIAENAFSQASSLESIQFGNVENLGGFAFYDCSSLVNISLPKVKYIDGKQTFRLCKSLKEVYFPEVLKIGASTFSECESLKKVNFPKVDSIGLSAFHQCYALESISLPSVSFIGRSAFYVCDSIKSLDLPNIETIDEEAFRDCDMLTSVSIPMVKNIGAKAFQNCKMLTSVSISKAENIGQFAFQNCNLYSERLQIPNAYTIGEQAFKNSCFEYVEIGNSLKEIGNDAFSHSAVISISADNVPTLNGTKISESGTIIVPTESLNNYRQAENWKNFYIQIIPNDVKTDFSATVGAKDGTSGLLDVIKDNELQYVMSLKLSGSINSYDFMLMRNKMPNLHYLDLSETMIKANPYEFVTGCYTEDNRLPKSAFRDFIKLYEINLPNSIKYIGECALLGCENLLRATLYKGIMRIEHSAFSDCTRLKSMVIPEGVTSIGNGAFNNTGIEVVTLGEGLLSLEEQAFKNCKKLKNIELPSTLEFMGNSCFSLCEQLSKISLPAKLYSIESFTFNGCISLKEISLPARLHSIGYRAFEGCGNLTEIRIPPMIETIEDHAFLDCKNLKNIYVYIANAKDIKINQNTFSNWTTTHLYVPNFAFNSYYWDTQWSQFVQLEEFDDKYETFYSKNTITLDKETGTITGTPDATLHENGGLIVDDEEKQELNEIQLKTDGINGATLIPENSGNITAKKVDVTIKVTANKWHFFCFPFDVPLSGMTYEGEYVWRRYDGAKRSRREGGWQNLVAGTTILEAGRGYIFQGTTTGELILSVENPDITASDVKTGLEVHPSDNSQDASWNFVGNPYVSYYSIDATTYSSPITIWNGTGYEAYRPGDDDYMFHPYQAFFVQTPVDASEIGFDATARESYEQSQTSLAAAKVRRAARKMNVNRLLANLELFTAGDTTYMDKTRIVFNDKENMEYDAVSDAAKFMSSERAAEFYTLDSKNVQYAINERPMASGDVRMGFIANKAGEYRIAQSRSDVEMLLVDHQEGITHNLGTGAYTFSSGAGTFDNRFTLKVNGEETGITELKEKTGIDLTVDGELCINGAADEVKTSVYQLNGVLAGTIQGSGSLRLPKGIYAVKVGLLTLKVQI